jgi:lipopolysaccharide export system permease protein
MGRTLFLYLFKDLMKIFLLASLVLAGVMSLGGLLQPLMKFGLDATQLGQMWLFLMPAMMTYSMPVAAVFATSVVYGRLTADNELTACRAAGIGYGSILAPGVAMGLVASLVSLTFLSFAVPFFFLQAERVIYTNVAKLVAAEIERKHEFSAGRDWPTIFAQRAEPGVTEDGVQTVVLDEPLVISKDSRDPEKAVPKTFYLARKVTLYIRHGEDNSMELSGEMEGATAFQRVLGSRPDMGGARMSIKPITLPSLLKQQMLKQQTKFMNVLELGKLSGELERTARVKRAIKQFIESEQQHGFYEEVTSALARGAQGYVFGATEERYQLTAPGAKWEEEKGQLRIQEGREPIRLTIRRPDGRVARVVEAKSARLDTDIDNEAATVVLMLNLEDVTIPMEDQTIGKQTDQRIYEIPMSEPLKAMRFRKAEDYVDRGAVSEPRLRLARDRIVAANEITAEMHSRASYGVSCLVLVLMGAVLGVQFKSGDYLTAFAVSVIPALLSITLVVSGAQTATNVPPSLRNPLLLGLVLIWVGNAIAGILALGLFQRIRRT